jgi:hypothetical protein
MGASGSFRELLWVSGNVKESQGSQGSQVVSRGFQGITEPFYNFETWKYISGTVFVALEARTAATNDLTKHQSIINQVYKDNEQFQEKWGNLQQRLRCCGAYSYLDFNTIFGRKCAPKSCCIDEDNCSGLETTCLVGQVWKKIYIRGMLLVFFIDFKIHKFFTSARLRFSPERSTLKPPNYWNFDTDIFTLGCLDILARLYRKDLPMGTLVVAIGIVATALAGIIAVALAAAFVAQMTRRAKRWDVNQGVRDTDILKMDAFEQ